MIREWLLFLTVLVCGLWPALQKSRLLGTQALVGIFALGLLTLATAAVWSVKETPKKRTAAEFSDALPREGRTGGYVTSDTCQARRNKCFRRCALGDARRCGPARLGRLEHGLEAG